MLRAAANYPWEKLEGQLATVVLTYPGDEFPMDGKVCMSHLAALWKRWKHAWGTEPAGMWGKEYQIRGALHFNLGIAIPRGVRPEVFRWWGFEAWSDLAGYGQPAGRSDVWDFQEGLRFSVTLSWYANAQRAGLTMADYFSRHQSKEAQKVVPVGFQNPGRWWGYIKRPPPKTELEVCCDRAFYAVRRAAQEVLERRLGRSRKVWPRAGLWTVVEDSDTWVRVLAWAMTECGCGGDVRTSV